MVDLTDRPTPPPAAPPTHRVGVARGVVEVLEDGRGASQLTDVVPDGDAGGRQWGVILQRPAARGRRRAGGGVGAPRPAALPGGVQQPAGCHALGLAVQQEGAETVGDAVVGEETEVELAELEGERELGVDLQQAGRDGERWGRGGGREWGEGGEGGETGERGERGNGGRTR